MATDPEGHPSFVPRLLSFYQDVVLDGHDFSAGYRTVAWGIRWFDGSVVTLAGPSAERPPAVTLWPSVDDAVKGLDALVGDIAPQRSVRENRDTEVIDPSAQVGGQES